MAKNELLEKSLMNHMDNQTGSKCCIPIQYCRPFDF